MCPEDFPGPCFQRRGAPLLKLAWGSVDSKKPLSRRGKRLFVARGSLTMTYFRTRVGHYHRRRGVSLSCSGWEGVVPGRYGRQTVRGNKAEKQSVWGVVGVMRFFGELSRCSIQGYRIKPHGQLVSVSSTHCCASTPDLSTLWSSTTLQGARGPGEVSS